MISLFFVKRLWIFLVVFIIFVVSFGTISLAMAKNIYCIFDDISGFEGEKIIAEQIDAHVQIINSQNFLIRSRKPALSLRVNIIYNSDNGISKICINRKCGDVYDPDGFIDKIPLVDNVEPIFALLHTKWLGMVLGITFFVSGEELHGILQKFARRSLRYMPDRGLLVVILRLDGKLLSVRLLGEEKILKSDSSKLGVINDAPGNLNICGNLKLYYLWMNLIK